MKIKLHVTFSNAENNMEIMLQHTGIHYPTKTKTHTVEIEVPDPPKYFLLDRITVASEE